MQNWWPKASSPKMLHPIKSKAVTQAARLPAMRALPVRWPKADTDGEGIGDDGD